MNVLNEKMLRLLLLSFFWINCMLAYGQSVTVILSKTNIADQKRDAGNQECYKIQLKNKSSKPIGLAGQNYRLYYNSDAVILDENDIENFLPDTYTSLELIQHEFDVDATGFGILPYESHLGFINLATDYKLSSGSPVMLGVGKTIDVAGLCFNISDSKQSSDLTWAHEDVTQSYATAFVEIATVEGSRLKKLHIDDLVVEGTATSVWQQERVLNFDYFPNPFTDQLDIKFNHVLDSDADLEVLDVFGRLLDSGSLVKGTDHITLKGEKYPDGALVIKITQNDGEVASFKAVKMK